MSKQLMRLGKLAWPSLFANRARIYGKISPNTLWAFDLRLGGGVVQYKFSASFTETDYIF